MDGTCTLLWREWNSGLIWGGALLLLALGLLALLRGEIREARAEVPTLSPASVAELELERSGSLVDVEGFELRCEAAIFDGERLLAPGYAADHSVMILVRFEHTSDCRDAAAAFGGPVRAKASLGTPTLSATLGAAGTDAAGRKLVLVEPHEVPYWMLGIVLFLAITGALGVVQAMSTRRKLLNGLQNRKPATRARDAEPDESHRVEADDRNAADPYRPGGRGRLITEAIAPSAKLLAELRRMRTIQATVGVILVVAALASAGWGGASIYEREQIWSAGELAPEAVADGKVRRSWLIFVHTELDVTFVDVTGTLHREPASSWSLIGAVDDSVPPVVRYLPDEPERFAVSWIHEQLWGSLAFLLTGVAVLLGLGLLALYIARRNRRPQQVAAVFDDPREAVLELLSVKEDVESRVLTYQFGIGDSDRTWAHGVLHKQPVPLFLDDAGTIALGLYHPRDPDTLIVLSEDLCELAGPPLSPAQLRGRFRASQAPAS